MNANKERFLSLVTETDTKLLKEIEYRAKHRARLKESFMIGVKVLVKLRALGWSQIDLAEKMQVSPQQVNKIVRGKQNLTLDTLVRLQQVLDIPLLASYYDSIKKRKDQVVSFTYSHHMPILKNALLSGTKSHFFGKSYSITKDFIPNNPDFIKIAG